MKIDALSDGARAVNNALVIERDVQGDRLRERRYKTRELSPGGAVEDAWDDASQQDAIGPVRVAIPDRSSV